MKTIYVLTEGSYSDYRIIGVYSTKDLAQEAKSLHPCSEIEEYTLDNIPDHPPGMSAWCVRMTDGTIDYCAYQISPFGVEIPIEFEYHNSYSVYCWATDKEHAEKIALDKYYQHQATKAGIA